MENMVAVLCIEGKLYYMHIYVALNIKCSVAACYDQLAPREFGNQVPNKEFGNQVPNKEFGNQVPNKEFGNQVPNDECRNCIFSIILRPGHQSFLVKILN